MKKELALSVNPLYGCNFRCNFCYLTPDQLSSKNILSLSKLENILDYLSKHRKISHIDLYGGEITLLSESYINDLFVIFGRFFSKKVNLVTNLSQIKPVCLRNDVTLSVSWDSDLRQDSQKVFNNILAVGRDVNLLMLASPKMIDWSDQKLDEVISILNLASNIVSVEIKPYSSNQSNNHPFKNINFEKFIMRWLQRINNFNFDFINLKYIDEALAKTRNAWSDDHLYITPEGRIAALDFDDNYQEFFLPIDSIEQYESWCRTEKDKINNNHICKNCTYLGHCLSEHLKNHKDSTDSCDGFKNLLDHVLLSNQKADIWR